MLRNEENVPLLYIIVFEKLKKYKRQNAIKNLTTCIYAWCATTTT